MKPSVFAIAASLFAATLAIHSDESAAAPCAGFIDVDTSSGFCQNVEWIKNRKVTLGCSIPQSYCPDEAVSRLQMAAFMNRLGTALTPVIVVGKRSRGTTFFSGSGDGIRAPLSEACV